MINIIRSHFRRKFWSAEKYARYVGVNIGKDCNISTIYFSSEPYLITVENNVRIANDVKKFTHGG